MALRTHIVVDYGLGCFRCYSSDYQISVVECHLSRFTGPEGVKRIKCECSRARTRCTMNGEHWILETENMVRWIVDEEAGIEGEVF